jgi:hypothetical protein
MKKLYLYLITFILMFSMSLAACSLLGNNDQTQDESPAQTMAALGLTQTAIAENSIVEQAESEVQAPTPEPDVSEAVEAAATEAITEEATEVVETEAPTEVPHSLIPGEPGWVSKWFADTNSALTASGGYVTAGDDFTANLYERPFSENEMYYFSDLDIQKAEISEDSSFFYVTITVDSYHPDGGLQAGYGVEIDEDKDGRGDLLIVVDRPFSTTWDIAGVTVRRDGNNDVGGASIMRPDTNYAGDSYEQVLFSLDVLDDPDMAWARVTDPAQPKVTIAFKKSILTSSTFLWGVWAADTFLELGMLDLQDYFTQEEAGSPYPSHSTFPLRSVNMVDNTCREAYGFTPTAPIYGLCAQPVQPTATTKAGGSGQQPTSEPGTYSISGKVWDDTNNNGIWDASEKASIASFQVTLHSGSCSTAAIRTATSNSFVFMSIPAGNYCIKINQPTNTPNSYNFTLPGGSTYFEFGIQWN